jgi:signal peptidase I
MEATTRKLIRDYAGTVLGAVAIAFLIRVYIIEAYRIPTLAMRPTLEPGDTVFVAKWPLGTQLLASSDLKRGDVILFRNDDPSARDYIKRIVATEGETVEIRKGQLWINGKQLAETVGNHGNCGTEMLPDGKTSGVCYEPPVPDDLGPVQVPSNSYFVLGDFRSLSQMDPTLKGKSWGIVFKSWIKGKALWLWLSVEPPTPSEAGSSSGKFPKLRFERMFRRIQ